MGPTLQEIWDNSLRGTVKLKVSSKSNATALRMQLYRYRERIRSVNKSISGAAICEYDESVIQVHKSGDYYELHVTRSPIDILGFSLEEREGKV